MRWSIEFLGAALLTGSACAWFAAFVAFGRSDDALGLYLVALGLLGLWSCARLTDFSARGAGRR